MDILLFTLAILSMTAAGLGLVTWLAPEDADISLVEALCLAFLLGIGVVSLALFWLGRFVSGWILAMIVLAVCFGLAVSGWGWLVHWRQTWTIQRPKPLTILLLIILGIQSSIVVWLTMQTPLGWDALFVWELKARAACLNGGTIPAAFFTDPTRTWNSLGYPLLLPLSEGWIYIWLGRCDQASVKALFPLFYLAALGLLYAGGKRLGGSAGHGFMSASLLFLIPQVWYGPESVSGGYADFPLGVIYLAVVIYLAEYWKNSAGWALNLVGVLAALMTWTKREGMVLAVFILAMAAIQVLARGDRRALLRLALPTALVLGSWLLYLNQLGLSTSADMLPITVDAFVTNRLRLRFALYVLFTEMREWWQWGGIWVAGLGVTPLLLLSRAWYRRLLPMTAFVPLALACAVYIFSSWQDFTVHIASSLFRQMLQMVPLIVLMVGIAFPRVPDASDATSAGVSSVGRVEHVS